MRLIIGRRLSSSLVGTPRDEPKVAARPLGDASYECNDHWACPGNNARLSSEHRLTSSNDSERGGTLDRKKFT